MAGRRSPRADVPRAAPVVLGASVTGEAHARIGLPCQDAFHTLVRDDVLVVAVADGLGSAAHSDVGAATASAAAALRAIDFSDGDPCRAAVEGIVAAREALETLATDDGYTLTDLACTLIVAVAAERIGIGHVGDGAAIGLSGEEHYVLSPPGPTEYINEVDALTSTDWVDNVRCVGCSDRIDALGLFTDGCQHAAVRRENGSLRAHAGFFAPLFAYVRSGVSAVDGNLALAELLAGGKMGEHSDDDKTLVLVVLR